MKEVGDKYFSCPAEECSMTDIAGIMKKVLNGGVVAVLVSQKKLLLPMFNKKFLLKLS